MYPLTVRVASPADAAEAVRLARLMFESMGLDASGAQWQADGEDHVRRRLGTDLAVFVVDDPAPTGRLVASAAGTIAQRLPTPANPSGLAGYVQWVATEPAFRRQGLGRAVMQALLGLYRDRDVPNIELHATPVAEPMYRALGFDDAGSRALRWRSWVQAGDG